MLFLFTGHYVKSDIPIKKTIHCFGIQTKQYPLTYPNPFNETTTIIYSSQFNEDISIKLYTSKGIYIDQLYNDKILSNTIYQFELDGKYLPPGMYYYIIENGKNIIQRKIEIIR